MKKIKENREEVINEKADNVVREIPNFLWFTDMLECMVNLGLIDAYIVEGISSDDRKVRLKCRLELVEKIAKISTDFFTNDINGIKYIDNTIKEREKNKNENYH